MKETNTNFIELIHEKLLDTFIFNAISDWKGILMTLNLSCVCFHRNKWLPMWNLTSYQRSKPKDEEAIYCVLGCNKGEIYFVDIADRSQYITKVHFHSEPLKMIREIKHNNPNFFSFLSISTDRQISVWNLKHSEAPLPLLTLTYNRDITYIELYYNFLLIGEKSGEFNILELRMETNSIQVLKSTNTSGHLRPVICGDHIHYKDQHLFLSGGEDSAIRIWKGI
jgi:WD40 repeat protein